MPRPKNPQPTYLHHKPTGQAYCRVPDGKGGRKTIYLGEYGSSESKIEHTRILAQLAGSTAVLPTHTGGNDSTVNELVFAYAQWVNKNRPTTKTRHHVGGTDPRYALRALREMFGTTPAGETSPECERGETEAGEAQDPYVIARPSRLG
jgi:hypothetical protein